MGAMGLGRERSPHASLPTIETLENKGDSTGYKKRKGAKALSAAVLGITLIAGKDEIVESGFSSETVISKSEVDYLVMGHGTAAVKTPTNDEIIFKVFNTAAGSSYIKTPQSEFVQLPYYKKVIQGDFDAPIIGIQEAGWGQVKKLSELNTDGNFSYSYIKPKLDYGGNLLIVPKRFEVLENQNLVYSIDEQVKGLASSFIDGSFDASHDVGQVIPRMLTRARLKDSHTGRVFTVFNTHLSFAESIQQRQLEQLSSEIGKIAKDEPVVLMGDLNADHNDSTPHGQKLKKMLQKHGLIDMGPKIAPKGKLNVDSVAARGFTSIKSGYVYEMKLPSSPTAEKVSDHYAEIDKVRLSN